MSNNGARIRWIIYKKGLEGSMDIVPPQELGGLKDERYLALNPQGKMPLMVLPDGLALPESQVIESYLLDAYKGVGPDLVPPNASQRAVAALAARILDVYITPIQGSMYKQMDVDERYKGLKQISFQLDALEHHLQGLAAPYVAGEDISFGDGALFPTFVFFVNILPRHYGWKSVFTGRPKLEIWWNAIQKDAEIARCIREMEHGLEKWEAAKRWDTLGITQQVQERSDIDWTCGN